MTENMVLTVIATDRPGLVKSLADIVTAHGGNWIDSSMARLGGEFAGILHISLPGENAPRLESAMKALGKDGILVTLRQNAPAPPREGCSLELKLVGQDHQGIVRDVMQVLASHNVSVDELQTSVFEGSMSGQPMFCAQAEIILPPHVDMETVRAALEDIANDIMVDIELSESPDES